MNILLTGATGLIGKKVGQLLVKHGHTVFAVSRNVEKAKLEAPYPAIWIECDLEKNTLPLSAPEKIDGVIHLAGENVGERSWSAEQKKRILSSRTAGTRNLLASLHLDKLPFLIGASAVGYYGSSHKVMDETSAPGTGFLSEVTQAWEREVSQGCEECRVCLLRLGVVLSTEGGALPRMVTPAQIFASSALGSGKQWLSWLHIEDAARAFVFAAENASMRGIYNLAAPEPIEQKVLAQTIAHELGAFNGPPVPSLVLKMLLGEQAAMVLDSQRVSAQKIQNTGFQFHYPQLTPALHDLLGDWKYGYSVKKFEQYFDIPKEDLFRFFALADNLEKITPQLLNFRILKKSTEDIEEGTLIDYSLKIRGVPVKWRTRIESWNPPHSFVDTQLKGPYSHWHHTHTFEDLGRGTLMKDSVKFKLPMGMVGRVVALAMVNKDVDSIFSYRRKAVLEYL